MSEPAIIVHGGAWAIPEPMVQRSRDGVQAAARRGLQLLQAGGTAVDAVEAAVLVMEDDPVFDCGTGSVLNAKGEVEMDAIIMDGEDLSVGAVSAVQNIRNPIGLARMVKDKSDHTMIVGKGANEFAEELGVPSVPLDDLVTQEAKDELQTFLNFKTTVDVSFRQQSKLSHDTVGAAAVDKLGNVAFATSTGGITCKRVGRVGDTPLIGCGGYADNAAGACSTTGHGESITKVCLARHVTDLMKTGADPMDATKSALEYMSSRVKGHGGAIALNSRGDIGWHFTTERMAWAWAREDTLHHGLKPGEDIEEKL